jgi:hypothetical protein
LGNPRSDFLVAQKVVVHILDRAEFMRPMLPRHRDLGMSAVETVEEVYILEVVYPPAKTQEVVRSRREEIDGRRVESEKLVYI